MQFDLVHGFGGNVAIMDEEEEEEAGWSVVYVCARQQLAVHVGWKLIIGRLNHLC